ncbi:Hemoglobinase [Clonorchis sinensis]|uniref:Hemoglobinase n=1 Tax=Clonorchis sinensis TaxID=79923 RepID=A0A419PHQ8_CLOSI|nr:Hemoglobinase [Clonorchis sinensis]
MNFRPRHKKLQVSLEIMRGYSLLTAFLFCINHVAWLEAAGVHNLSAIFNENPSKNWVVLVAGSNTWKNYRHQADVYHAYQVVRANKVPAENIITLAYDDIAKNPKNPFKGKVFHDYEHEDVYKGVVIDYRGKDVTAKNFLKVLRGDKTLEANRKKVLKSGPDDYVFIFYSGHGLDGLLTFPVGDYKKLVMYVEACYAGSMFRDVLPSNMGVYVTTSSNPVEQSWSVFCLDKFIDVCLADEYSYAWITDSQYVSFSRTVAAKPHEGDLWEFSNHDLPAAPK